MSENQEIEEQEEKSLSEECGEIVLNSLITSFGLDMFIKDKHGGDVDTIQNVRKIGKDPNMEYKNKNNAEAYKNRGDYDSLNYHSGDKNYRNLRKEYVQKQKNGETLTDWSSGKVIKPDEPFDFGHKKSSKEIHEDRGRILAGYTTEELASSRDNLGPENRSDNRAKGKKSDEDALEHVGGYKERFTDEQIENKRQTEKKVDRNYNVKLAKKYYTSKEFWSDTGLATLKTGVEMGARQVVGLVFTEIWFTVTEKIEECNGEPADYFNAVGEGVKEGYNRALKRFDVYIKKFLEGSVSGALASLVTTLVNIFFTTAKNVVKIIRELFSSLLQTARILIFNPEKYPNAVKRQEALKVLAAGLGVIAGRLTREALEQSPIGKLPELGNVISTFCDLLVSGILTCSFIRIINHLLKKSINFQLATYYYNKQEDIDVLFTNDNNLGA